MLVRCVITAAGSVEGCEVLRGLPLAEAAVLAALQARQYRPAEISGRPGLGAPPVHRQGAADALTGSALGAVGTVPLYEIEEVGGPERFQQHSGDGGVLHLPCELRVSGYEDDPSPRRESAFARGIEELEAVHHRHHEVEQYEARRLWLFVQDLERLHSVARRRDLDPWGLGLEKRDHRASDVWIILDDEHVR